MTWLDSNRKVKELLSNFVLLAIVVVSWTYVVIAGRFVSRRYLQNIDLSEYYREEHMSQLFEDI